MEAPRGAIGGERNARTEQAPNEESAARAVFENLGSNCRSRAARSAAGGTEIRECPPLSRSNRISGQDAASSWTEATIRAASVASARRNFRRAGVLKNRSRTSTTVPGGSPAGRSAVVRPPSTRISQPASASSGRVPSRNRETEAIAGSASPRNPSEPISPRSSTDSILLVAWRSRAHRASSGVMPIPSSVTRISPRPAFRETTETFRAPASMEFSTSSRTTAAGRSTTSPAAIWLATAAGSLRTWPIPRRPPSARYRPASDSISPRSPASEKRASSRTSRASRFARTAGSSASTRTSSKNRSTAGPRPASAPNASG